MVNFNSYVKLPEGIIKLVNRDFIGSIGIVLGKNLAGIHGAVDQAPGF